MRKNGNYTIKSFVGSDPSLINASKSTRITYKISNFVYDNAITKPKDIIKKIISCDKSGIEYYDMRSNVYKSNIKKIDSSADIILASICLSYYQGKDKYINKLCKDIDIIKSLLFWSLIGMTPSKSFNFNNNEMLMGSIIVKKDTSIISYNLDETKELLYNNSYLDTPSTSRHDFAKIYTDGNEMYIDLALQVRIKSF